MLKKIFIRIFCLKGEDILSFYAGLIMAIVGMHFVCRADPNFHFIPCVLGSLLIVVGGLGVSYLSIKNSERSEL